jgi:hypothetical protein
MRMLAMVLFALSVFGQDEGKQPVQITTTEQVSFASGGTLHLTTAASNLMVEAWDKPGVEITAIKSAKSRDCLDKVRIVKESRSSTDLAITAEQPSHWGCSVKLELQIRTPRDSHLIIHHGAGYLSVSRVTGEIEAISRSGDIVLMLTDDPDKNPDHKTDQYSIDAKTKWGNISSDFGGDAHNVKLLGEEFSRTSPSPSHRIYLRIGFGGIPIKEVPSTPEAPEPLNAQE